MTPNPTDSKAVAMVHSGEPVAARFARAFAEAPVTVQPAGPAAEVFVLAPIVLGEALSSRAIVSSLLIFAGVLVVTRRRTRAFVPQTTAIDH